MKFPPPQIGATAAKRNVKIEIAEATGDTPFISADRSRLKQVLVNLITNAVQFNRDGGSVTLRPSRTRPQSPAWRGRLTSIGKEVSTYAMPGPQVIPMSCPLMHNFGHLGFKE